MREYTDFTLRQVLAGKQELVKHYTPTGRLYSVTKKLNREIKCVNGLKVSIQARDSAYCSPRDNNGPYHAVEIGFPNMVPPDYILEYQDGDGDPCESVYGYVPVELVLQWVEESGGEKDYV